MQKLTAKQERFVYFYEGDRIDAAEKAGFRGSRKTLSQTAYKLLNNPIIKKALAKRQKKEGLRSDMAKAIADRNERMEMLSNIARNDTLLFYKDKDGNVKTTKPEVSNRDKIAAIDTLNQMDGTYKIYENKHVLSDPEGKPVQFAQINIIDALKPIQAKLEEILNKNDRSHLRIA